MIRDDKMMQLVAPDKEPITPFVRKVRSLYEDKGISSIIVVGGSGDYFDVADHVIMMDCYKCLDVTERAKEIVTKSTNGIEHDASSSMPFGTIRARTPIGEPYKADGKVSVKRIDVITYGDTELHLSGLEQIVTKSQTAAIAQGLQKVATLASSGRDTLPRVLDALEEILDKDGLDSLAPGQFNGGLARPRRLEMAGAINRLRRKGSMVQK
mmetsp:Transcript_6143/g.8708  ORF Transcript_6143/g.8708 Transcript_6143/m.8708 type:complete len:211 (+) Transcript_6143:111-743(+)